MNIKTFISNKLFQTILKIGIPVNCKIYINQSNNILFGDYQINGIIKVAKILDISPVTLAQKIIQNLALKDIAYKIEIAGSCFINIFLDKKWLAKQIFYLIQCPNLILKNQKPQTIVVDYSSPNVAKEMHVGHMRSTILGDAVTCTLSFLGHKVIRANHIGDWGTQFGMLIAYLESEKHKSFECYDNITLSDLEDFYRQAQKKYDEDKKFAKKSRDYVVKLQAGDKYCRIIWKKLINITMNQNQKIYDRLNVTLKPKDIMGESLYQDMLSEIVNDLCKKGLAVVSQGAKVVFLDEFKNKTGDPMGVIIQKNDGAYLYTTTDIACIKYRYEKFHAQRILYYVDSRQHQHFQQVWAIVRKAKYIPECMLLEHHAFGMILGKDRKPFKTRSGDNVKLIDLLNEATLRAFCLVKKKNPTMSHKKLLELAEIVGIGAVKYAELSKNRTTDYIFDWDNMLTFEGNTAPYIQYAYTRVISILRKGNIDINNIPLNCSSIILLEAYDRQLAILLLQFEEVVTQVGQDGTPHILCSYLYKLASIFSSFYEHCPILSCDNKKIMHSRLQLSTLTAKILKKGLNILGIKTVERM